MPDGESDYKVGPGRPPLHTRFKKGQSGNPGGRRRSARSLPALLADALDEAVYVTIRCGPRSASAARAGATGPVEYGGGPGPAAQPQSGFLRG
jgi:Family of unknown function (DUF5681)